MGSVSLCMTAAVIAAAVVSMSIPQHRKASACIRLVNGFCAFGIMRDARNRTEEIWSSWNSSPSSRYPAFCRCSLASSVLLTSEG